MTSGGVSCARATGWRDTTAAVMLGFLAFVVFNANLRAITAADTYAARYLPLSMLRHHSVLPEPMIDLIAQGRAPLEGRTNTAFWLIRNTERNWVSVYPLAVPVIVTPLYLPAYAYLSTRGWDPHRLDQAARVMEKVSASLIASASVALLYLLLRRRGSPGVAATLTLLYAFGTTTWVISSQALWMHGLAQLCIVATMLLITGRRSLPRVALAGVLCGLIASIRPPDTILAAALGLYGLWWAGRMAPAFILGGLLPAGLTLAYNWGVIGHVAGGYGMIGRANPLNDDIAGGIAGLLFSPTRGLFVFSPFLLFVPLFFLRALRAPGSRVLTLAIAAAMAVQVAGYAMVDWRQGVSWGPRWLTDMLPLLMWLLVPIVASLSRPGRVLFGAASAVAVTIQVMGAFWYTGAHDGALLAATGPGRMGPMWDIRNASFIADIGSPPAPRDLLRFTQGNIDQVEVTYAAGEDGRIERVVDVAGWALADGRTPADIAIVVDGVDVVGTGAFLPRPDVSRTIGTDSPSGWVFRIPADHLQPGQHRLSAIARADDGGDTRLIRSLTFMVQDESLGTRRGRLFASAAALAERKLAARQQPGGYWLTAFTAAPRFERPQDELNTYLNAVMLDIAGPAATTPGLQAMLARARAYLSAQIEADGLVRYHGRPDAPTIGTLGCAITPDSDDTALVWRVAPAPDRDRLSAALGIMEQFRRPDGLFRTWLADRSRFECLDPGRDPNPADIGIQMHILMLLAQQDPPAAAALCQAMAQRRDDDGAWVYYAGAPPMILLRLPDMDAAGCALDLPAARLRTDVPGQQRWVEAAELLRQLEGGMATPDVIGRAARWLQDLSAQDFAAVATSPPLLYHNDLTATVRRFYWSGDVGYALWLRLHHAWRRAGCEGDGAAPGCGGP